MLLPCVWLLPNVMVSPSGLALATVRVPIAPAAPDTFSTITCWPSGPEMSAATMRAITSVGPPAG